MSENKINYSSQMIGIIIALVVIFLVLAIASGFITDATRRMTVNSDDENDVAAHNGGKYASIVGWVTVAAIIAICVALGFGYEAFISPAGGTLLKVVVYGLFGLVILASGACGGLAAYAASKTRAGVSYPENRNVYNYFVGAGITCILVVVAVIGVFGYQLYLKYRVRRRRDAINDALQQRYIEHQALLIREQRAINKAREEAAFQRALAQAQA